LKEVQGRQFNFRERRWKPFGVKELPWLSDRTENAIEIDRCGKFSQTRDQLQGIERRSVWQDNFDLDGDSPSQAL